MLQGFPLDPSCLSDPALLLLVVVTVNPPQGGVASAAVTLREEARVILQYYCAISSLLTVKMIPAPIPNTRGPQAYRKGSWALCHAFW